MIWTQEKLYYNIIMPFNTVLEELQWNGIKVDINRLDELEYEFTKEKEYYEKEIFNIAGYKFNTKATQQKAKLLYQDLKIPYYITDYNWDNRQKEWAQKDFLFLTKGGVKKQKKANKDKIKFELSVKDLSTDVHCLRKIRAINPHPIVDLLLEHSQIVKLLDTYIIGMRKFISPDSRVHPSFWQNTLTGRPTCIAKGSYIECVRDVSKYPKGKKIEEIRAGDLVYCLGKNGNPEIKPVVWAGLTGRKKVYRLHWRSTCNKKYGYLDATIDHKINTVDSGFQTVDQLKETLKNKKEIGILSISRHRDYVNFTNKMKKREHRFIYEQLVGSIASDECIHHIDFNHKNNNVDNLQKLTKKEHAKLHGDFLADNQKIKDKISKTLKQKYKNGEIIHTSITGEENPLSYNFSKFHCWKLLAKAKGHPTEIPHDFGIMQKYFKKHNIPYNKCHYRYDRNGGFITKTRLKFFKQLTYKEITLQTGLAFRTIKKLFKDCSIIKNRKIVNQYGTYNYNNHKIYKIEEIGYEDVYDITVKDNHNFYANELNVHNCTTPNMLQIPSRSERGRKIKEMFIADEGYSLIAGDFSQMELRFIAWLSGDTVMNDTYKADKDIHATTAAGINKFNITYEEAILPENKDKRDVGKETNFTMSFLGGAGAIQRAFLKQGHFYYRKDCSEFINSFFNTYPDVKTFHNTIKVRIEEDDHVKNLFSRKQYFDLKQTKKQIDIAKTDKEKKDAKDMYDALVSSYLRKAVSMVVQGSSTADYSAYKTIKLAKLAKQYKGSLWSILYDGYFCQIPENKVDEFGNVMKDYMETPEAGVTINLPIDLSKSGKKWSDLK